MIWLKVNFILKKILIQVDGKKIFGGCKYKHPLIIGLKSILNPSFSNTALNEKSKPLPHLTIANTPDGYLRSKGFGFNFVSLYGFSIIIIMKEHLPDVQVCGCFDK